MCKHCAPDPPSAPKYTELIDPFKLLHLETVILSLKYEVKQLNAKVAEVSKERDTLATSLQDRNAAFPDAFAAERKIANLTSKIGALHEEIRDLKDAVDRKDRGLHAMNMAHAALHEKNKDLTEQVRALNARLSTFRPVGESEELVALRKERDKYEDKLRRIAACTDDVLESQHSASDEAM
jgi:chromosome segregation ATPase